jgi:hypothetical protein
MSFKPGTANLAGRSKGSRNRLSGAFLTALADDFEQGGVAAIKICRIEDPSIYCRLIASILPREFTFEDNRMTELSDSPTSSHTQSKLNFSRRARSTVSASSWRAIRPAKRLPPRWSWHSTSPGNIRHISAPND